MSISKAGLVALALLVAAPAFAADADPAPDTSTSGACAPAVPARKGAGLSGLLAAAGRAGALDMLRSGAPVLGSGKGNAVVGAVLGGALNAADQSGPAAGLNPAMLMVGGDNRDAQIAGVAAGTLVGLARSHAAPAAVAPCAG